MPNDDAQNNNYWTPNWITNQSNKSLQTFGTKETAQCPLSPCWIQIKCFSYACLPCWFLHMYFEENYSNNLCIKVVAYKKRYSTICSFMPWSFDLKKISSFKKWMGLIKVKIWRAHFCISFTFFTSCYHFAKFWEKNQIS